MIRTVNATTDAAAIVEIYNFYILNTTISFETAPLSTDEMMTRIKEIASGFPYFVEESEGKILGYCYAHPWKQRAAYCHTLETTVYLSPDCQSRGLGTKLMEKLIAECSQQGYKALIACVTGGNLPSYRLHRKLGFHQASEFKAVGRKFDEWIDVVDFELLLS